MSSTAPDLIPDDHARQYLAVSASWRNWLEQWLVALDGAPCPEALPSGIYGKFVHLLAKAHEATAADGPEGYRLRFRARQVGESTPYELICKTLPRSIAGDQERLAFLKKSIQRFDAIQVNPKGISFEPDDRMLFTVWRETCENIENLANQAIYLELCLGSRPVPRMY